MDGGWVPNEEGVRELCQLFEQSNTTVSERHNEIYHRIESFNDMPDFNNYLVFILVNMQDVSDAIRATAGLLLKKNVSFFYHSIHPEVRYYVQNEVVKVIGDPSLMVRNACGAVITAMAEQGGLQGWPELLEYLTRLLDSDQELVVEGTLSVMSKLCQDIPGAIDSDEAGRPLEHLIPKWMGFFLYQNDRIRLYSLQSIVNFIPRRSQALLVHLEQFVQGLYSLAMDENIAVRRSVCEAMVSLLQVRPDLLLAQIDKIVEYMLHCSASNDELLALEACEFWSSFAEAMVARAKILPHLPALMPVLLRNMVYSEFDIMCLGGDVDDNADVQDRRSDIEPRFHHARVVGGGEDAGRVNPGEEDEDEDDEDGEDKYLGEWNLRKSAAAAMDILAGVYKAELLEHLIPVLEAAMNSERWDERESSILALGAIAQGCSEALGDYLPALLGFLMERFLVDPKPLIRKITCWTLSRYARWIVTTSSDHSMYLLPVLEGLLKRTLDRNKQVQEAACSALAMLEEEACSELAPYLGDILPYLKDALSMYQIRNLNILFDAIGTLAESVGNALANEELVCILMPALVQKWGDLAPDDQTLFPLMECLTTVAQAIGPYFTRYAQPIFERCVNMIQAVLEAYRDVNASYNADLPSKDFVVCSLDLLSGVIEAVGPRIEELVGPSNLLLLLQAAMQDKVADVRQSSFAVIGDLAKTCIGHLVGFLPEFLPMLTKNLDPAYVSPCNNAGWAIGEIAMNFGPDIQPYVHPILERLVAIMNRDKTNRNLLENTAITIGRLGLQCPESVAPYLPRFIHFWCLALRNIRDDAEKESAFRGLCAMIHIYPQGVAERFLLVCDAIASWRRPPDDLKQMFADILFGFKGSLPPDDWNNYYYGEFPPTLRDILDSQYNLGNG